MSTVSSETARPREGQVWEAAMSASHYRLDNVCAIIDNNGLQIDGHCCDVMALEPIVDKWAAFGWHVIDVDGHDMVAVINALDEAETVKKAYGNSCKDS